MDYKLTSLKQNRHWLELSFRNDILAKLYIRLIHHGSEGNMFPIDIWLIDLHTALKAAKYNEVEHHDQ